MKETRWICDGCDAEEYRKEDGMPERWKQIEATIYDHAKKKKILTLGDYQTGPIPPPTAIKTVRAELCPTCQGVMVRKINPLEWPRHRPEKTGQ
jgi:hypothetical protein